MASSELGLPYAHTSSRERNPVDALLEMGWLLVALLVPLAINFWAKQPFEPAKAVLLRSLAWAMAALWLVDSLRVGRHRWRDLRCSPLFWPVLATLATQILATTLAFDPRLSLYGSYERAQGLLTLSSYALLFLVVSSRLRTVAEGWRLIAAMVASGLPLVIMAIVQVCGWQAPGLITDARSPVYATMGRSNFLGAYLAMLLPLTLALALVARPRWVRWAAGALVACEAVVTALTLARGAWLAAGVAIGTFLLLQAWPRLSRPTKVAWLGGGSVALLGALIGGFVLGSHSGSTAARLTIWQATIGLIARRPIFGYGPDSLGVMFARVYPPELVYYQGRGLLVDRAHNFLLDAALTTGLAGLVTSLAVLAVFALLAWQIYRRTVDPGRRTLVAACVAAVVGNTAGNLTGFDTTATATATWLLLALVAGLQTAEVTKRLPGLAPPDSWPPRVRSARLLAAGLVLVSTGLAIVQWNLRPLAADIAARTSERRASAGTWTAAIRTGEQAVALWPDEPAHHLALSWAYLQGSAVGSGDPIQGMHRAESELQVACTLRPGDYRLWAALGELYARWGDRGDASKLLLAQKAYRQASELAPNHATLYTAWGMVDVAQGDLDQAAIKFHRAVDLDATDAWAFTHLGDVELARGHPADALDAYRRAVHWEPALLAAYVGQARCYWQQGQAQTARNILARVLEVDPGNNGALLFYQEISARP